jgi:MoxR-like ATPase
MSAPIQLLLERANSVILGKDRQIRLALTCLFAGGDLLIEDLPGMGKTTLAHTLAALLGLQFQRIQFTSDMLPADILGASIFDRESGRFTFQHGPIFAQVILADEINRATPKTQSALLEAMEERQVTSDGQTRPLPEPFFVIATQNPETQIGTFPLPESQLDRFLFCLELGYPDPAAERELLRGEDRRALLKRLQPAMDKDELLCIQQRVPSIHAAEPLLAYLQALLDHSRHCGRYRTGLSPRAGLGLLRAAQAWALIDGREAVLPEDLQTVFPSVVAHRLRFAGEHGSRIGSLQAMEILEEVAIP